MTSHAVPIRCCCLQDVQATMQAGIDQLVGFGTIIRSEMAEVAPQDIVKHTMLVCAFMQEYLDDLVVNHGHADASHQVAAVQALAKAMVR